MNDSICNALIGEVRRRLFDECHQRIHKCAGLLTEEQIWWRPNEESNSIGNLILHLDGNVRQWIIAGITGVEDVRTRQWEFDTQDGMSSKELLERLDVTMTEVDEVLNTVNSDILLLRREVQTFEETVLAILIHVTEHFSYHTGQIAYITKLITERQVGFYEGVELE